MDRVRFGRALGKGARAAARAAVEAVDAATSHPAAATSQPSAASRPVRTEPRARTEDASGTERARPPRRTQPVTGEVLRAGSSVQRAARQAAGGMMAPVRTASRALWYELTGSFFALFALSFGGGAWHTRAGATSSLPSDQHSFYAFCLLAALFAYFSVSSFLRARKRPGAQA